MNNLTKIKIWHKKGFPLKIAPKINKIEAKVWVRKYLMADSLDVLFEELKIIGINLNVFNSNPTHLKNNEGEDKIIIILVITQLKKRINEGLINIGKKENSYRWGMSP